MITIKNKQAIDKMHMAGQLLAQLLSELETFIVAGISTFDIDAYIETFLAKNNLVSQSRGYKGYRHVSCISINDEVVHGIPHKDRIIKEGDLVKVDVCAAWKGYCADLARCYIVGKASHQIQEFIDVARKALNKGIEQAKPGNRLSDISASIQQEIDKHGYGIIRDFAGHGIGKRMHEEPEVLNYGVPGKGPVLRPGMALAIEPMITMGDYKVYIADDGWTVRTRDKSLAAHVEDTIIITQDGARVLTRLSNVNEETRV